MSTQPNDGGPAFPIQHSPDPGGFMAQRGMSQRDYFAAHALQGMLASEVGAEGICPPARSGETFEFTAARKAYSFADAMLRAREARL